MRNQRGDKHSLSHLDSQGQAHMVDVGMKAESARHAHASGHILMRAETLALIRDTSSSKGDVLAVARIAAIQAAKRTADLIPLCHPLMLNKIAVSFDFVEGLDDERKQPALTCSAIVECYARTGVEMEALTAVSVGLLTIYDMCKAVDRGMSIERLQLLEKKGGLSGHFVRSDDA
ncbi:MAG: cyclic pyranopterin monophosphate synthase MoaC [Pseudomonadota bacterium]